MKLISGKEVQKKTSEAVLDPGEIKVGAQESHHCP